MNSRLVIFISVVFLANIWTGTAAPSTSLVLRSTRQASASAFGDLTSNDTSVALSLEPDAPWEDFIMPSPTVISLLGQLMVISGKVDFSLVENAPQGGFKYMRYPESFRASLIQVSNDGWGAFLNAHKNMDTIQLSMQQVPLQVKAAMKILSSAPTNAIKKLMPIPLNKIQEIGSLCVKLSAETESKFADVMLLLGEMLAVTESSRGTHEQKLAEVQAELNVTAEQKKMMDQMGEVLKKRQADVDAEVKKRQAQYDQALNDIPTGWNAIGQDLARTVVGIIDIIPTVIHGIFGDGGSGGPGGTGGISTGNNTFEHATTLVSIRTFFDTLNRFKNQISDVFQGKNKPEQKPTDMLAAFRVVLNTFTKDFKGTQNDLTQTALGFVDDGNALYKQLQDIMKDFPAKAFNESETTEVVAGFDKLVDKMKPYYAQADAMSKGLSSSQSSGGGDDSSDCGGGLSRTGCNERYKAGLALKGVQEAEERQDKVFAETMKYYEEMKDLVGKMAKLNLEEISYKDILELLKQGIKLLAKIRAQWGKLVQFFVMVSVRAEVAMNQTMGPFLDYAKVAEESIGAGEDRKFYLDLLQSQAVDINRISYFLYTLSSTYFDVSSRYLMDRLAGLAQMLATDNEAERQRLLVDLNKQADEAQDAIKQMAQQRREEYTKLVNARKDELQNVVDKVGQPTEDDKKAIDSAYPSQPAQ